MAGMLMPVASLPSADGVGSLGREAYHLVDCMSDMGFRIWQLLPMNPLGYGNSPYQPYSSYAGDELYIDLDMLAEDGISKRHLRNSKYRGKRIRPLKNFAGRTGSILTLYSFP